MQTRQLDAGEVIQERYRIRHEVGAGGFARVYLGEDVRLGDRPVAVKIMSLEQVAADRREESARQFRAEAKLLAQLDHPGIVEVYDFFNEGNEFYLVMEFVTGQTLDNYLSGKGGSLPETEALGITAQIGSVLHHLHQQRDPASGQDRPVIYRDLKPANVVIRPDGSVKLLDFGIARFFKPGQTSDTQRFGTPGYAAPEQYGRGQTDARADVYSLGVLLHQMLSGYDPAISPMHLPPLAELAPRTSGRTAAAVQQATAANPDVRFLGIPGFAGALGISLPTTAALVGDRSAEDGTRVLAPAEGEKGRPRRVIYGGIAILLVATGLSAFLFMREDDPQATPRPTVTTEPAQEVVIVTATRAAGNEAATPLSLAAAAEATEEENEDNSPGTPAGATTTATPSPTATATITATARNTLVGSHTGQDEVPMLLVPAGQFLMGSTRQDVDTATALCRASGDNDPCTFSEFANEMPQRSVYLDAFYIDQTEITNERYRQCVAAGSCERPDYRGGRYPPADYYDISLFGNHPVIHVRWDQARAYCAWAGERLPTEAEWEKAARGTEGYLFPWGNEFDADLANTQEGGGDQLWPVGSYPAGASPYGLLDMAGGVWEWVEDWFDANYYSEAPDSNPPPAPAGTQKVLRGGSCSNFRHYARTTNRGLEDPNTSSAYRGFRCVLPADQVPAQGSE